MTNQHPITPPPKLVQQWYRDSEHQLAPYYVFVARCAAQWGADQELEACCEWVRSMFGGYPTWADELRDAHRPKPPSLKEQALALLDTAQESDDACNSWNFDTIRRALEALPND